MTPNTSDSDASIREHLQQLEARIDDLETENESLRKTVSEQSEQIEDQQEQIETLEEENTRLEAVAQAALKKSVMNLSTIHEHPSNSVLEIE
ncbi:hypothetical protein [Natrinema salaciae]|uniref:Cell division protein ZapB n=1 Tax=Natrinema salaciae TaxID=1186196 RepID=A0A1H9ETZ3_9EURY|nr:hypothetical protein [Natrinema salaciae]SEQ29226.1 hypothetical protein SAMN04489841_1384 [Natrinema salaciae]